MPRREEYQARKEHWRAYNRAYLRKWRLAHPKRKYYPNQKKQYLKDHPEEQRKHDARIKFMNALASGKVVRGECEKRDSCYGRIQAHHPDYDKPLEVEWVCLKHHREKHGILIMQP